MNPTTKRYGFPALGSYCEIQLYDDSRINAKNLVRRLGAEVRRIELKYAGYRRDSLITEINYSAGNKLGIKIDKETRQLLELARTYYEKSDGLFDISAGLLRRVWNFEKKRVPTQEQIDALLPRIGFDRLSWRGARLLLPSRMEIDFASFLKEYAVDSAAALGRSLGIKHGLINLGGVFAVIGAQPGQQPWTVGIANPEHNALMARIDLDEGGLATSGDYDNSLEHEGRLYAPVLNPKTGWPGNGLRAVSVAAPRCTEAAAMGIVSLLKEESEGLAWLEDSKLRYIAMSQSGDISGPGLKATQSAPAEQTSPVPD